MLKYAYLNGLAHIVPNPNETGVPVELIEDTLTTIFPDATIDMDYISGEARFFIDFTPVHTIKIGYNSAIHRFMIWADDFSVACDARRFIYVEFEKRFPGLIDKVRTLWDVSAKEVRGL